MKNVWIVDDDRSIRWVLEKALTREGLPYRSFENARDVHTALEDETPSVLVSDVRMPGESGLSLLKKIKAAHPQVPVIVMTAFSDLDTAVQAFQGGAFEYLPKPFDVDQALALIRRAVAVAEQALAGSMGRLMAVVEAYPELKADQTMRDLQEELSTTENRVGFARQAYNDTVMEFNNAASAFPTLIVAKIFSFNPAAMLQSTQNAAERQAPRVQM